MPYFQKLRGLRRNKKERIGEGHRFNWCRQVLYSSHSERALGREESAFRSFPHALSAAEVLTLSFVLCFAPEPMNVPAFIARRKRAGTLAALLLLASCGPSRENRIVIGSKNFTEQLVLGEIIAQQIEKKTHLPVERRFYLAGSYICHQAILGGRIDIYPEYTGTALTAILKQQPSSNPQQVYHQVKTEYAKRFHFGVGQTFGFNDTFAIEIRGEDARHLGLKTISQAATYTPQWRAGFGYEFTGRPDGYKGLAATYGLRFAETPSVMDLGLLARA